MYSPEARAEIVDHVCSELLKGERGLKRIVAEDDFMPSLRVIYDWISEDPNIAAQIERAREIAAANMLEETFEIAENVAANKDAIAKAKLRIYQREMFAAKIAPKRFGNKLDLTSGNEKLPAPAATDNRLQAIVQMVAGRKQAALPQRPEEENDNAED